MVSQEGVPSTDPRASPRSSRGGADDLVNLVAVHVRLLTKRLRHRNKRAGDSCARRRMFAKQAGLQDRLLAVHITRERLRI
nr:MAG TPA: hypothetical protein [Caudoviricetes sp.]